MESADIPKCDYLVSDSERDTGDLKVCTEDACSFLMVSKAERGSACVCLCLGVGGGVGG